MVKFEDMCMDIIRNTKRYIKNEDYEGLKKYIDNKEKDVEMCRKKQKNKTSEYVDKLLVSLK